MSLLIIGATAAGVAMMANANEDSPVLWGFITAVVGIAGASIFGMLGALIGCTLAAGLYLGKAMKFG